MRSDILYLNITINNHLNSAVDGYTDLSNNIISNNIYIMVKQAQCQKKLRKI